MSREFPIGQMNPYEIVLVTNTKNGVLTPSYFQSENTLIHRVLTDNAPHFITNSSITALSYFNEADVPYATAMGYLTPGTALYNSSLGFQYRVLVGGSMNTDRSASLVNIVTVVDPTSDAIIGFIDNIRATLNKYTTTPVVPGFPISMHLFGGYTSTYDVQTTLYGLVPVMVATTLVVVLVLVAINFGSVLISIRLFATGFIGLCWTYGLTVSYHSTQMNIDLSPK